MTVFGPENALGCGHMRTGRADRAQRAVLKARVKSGTKPKPFPVKSSVWN